MNCLKNNYNNIKFIIYPKENIRTNYKKNNSFLIKNAILKPYFIDEFGNFNPTKYLKNNNIIKINNIKKEELI